MENRWETLGLCTSIDAVRLRGWAAGFHVSPPAQPGRICFLGLCTRVCVPAGAGMCALCMQTCCTCRLGLCGYVRACVWVSIQMVRTGIWLSSPSSTWLHHGCGCARGRGWCEANCHGGTYQLCRLAPCGDLVLLPTLGSEKRTDLGVKKLGGKKNQRAQPGCLFH